MLRRVLCLCLAMLLCGISAGICEEEPLILRYIEEGEEMPALGLVDQLEVHLIDVGSADCILLRKGSWAMMIDSGNPGTADVIMDYLADIGVESLDIAFISHYHNDHIGGYLRILDEFPVAEVWLPTGHEDHASDFHTRLDTVIKQNALPTRFIENLETMDIEEITLSFYRWEKPSASHNDRSMMLHARYGGRSILLAADVENRAQKELGLAHDALLSADILKMPHHGIAAYMREFHWAVNPQLVTFSNAKHRIERNIDLAKQRHVDWLLTTKGTIVAVTDGAQWLVWQLPDAW